MAKPYVKLRMAIMEADIKQEELADIIFVNRATFSKKINALTPFSLYEAYTLLAALNLSDDKINEYFPRNWSVPHQSVLERQQTAAVPAKKMVKRTIKGVM